MNAKLLAKVAGLGMVAGIVAAAGAGVPALASGSQNLNPAKVCFVNATGQALYFRAVYSGRVTGGTKLGKGGKFCSAQPAPQAVRISREKDSKVLCNPKVAAGSAYTLTALSKDGKCSWSRASV